MKRTTKKAPTWADVSPRIRRDIEDRLRGGMLSSLDQAKRFRDPDGKHHDEATALEHDALAEEYRVALEALRADAAKGAK